MDARFRLKLGHIAQPTRTQKSGPVRKRKNKKEKGSINISLETGLVGIPGRRKGPVL